MLSNSTSRDGTVLPISNDGQKCVAQALVLLALISRGLRSRFAQASCIPLRRGSNFPMQLLHGFGERRCGRLIFSRQSSFFFTAHNRNQPAEQHIAPIVNRLDSSSERRLREWHPVLINMAQYDQSLWLLTWHQTPRTYALSRVQPFATALRGSDTLLGSSHLVS
jgi:hypothetical protein